MRQSDVQADLDSKTPTQAFGSLPPTVWVLGAMMFLINLSYVMVFSLCAVYLKSVMGVASGWIGAMEGLAEGVSYGAKLFSGVISDYMRKRKGVMIFGYALMVFSRPILAISSNATLVFSSIFVERLGNGIQATPRDALVSDIAPSHRKGASFGLKRSIGTAGSVCGALISMIAMYYTFDNYQAIFFMAAIPAFIAFLILIFMVKDPETIKDRSKKRRYPIHFADLPRLGLKYWLLMIVASVFMFARIGETYLALHAHQTFTLPEKFTPLVMITYNLTYALLTYPLAHLSDRMNRYMFLLLGVIALVLADFFLWSASSLPIFFVGVGLWGIQMGLSQSMFAALIADNVPHDLRGTGFGFFYLISAIASVFAGAAGGLVTHNFGEANAFLFSGCAAFVALILLGVFMALGKLNCTNAQDYKNRKNAS
jgi:MFS family permease